MSVTLERPVARPRVPVERPRVPVVDSPVVVRPRIIVDPPYRRTPLAPALPQPKVKAPSRTAKGIRFVVAKSALFGTIFGVTAIARLMCGQYMVDLSAVRGAVATSRAKAAFEQVTSIERQLYSLNSEVEIDNWAAPRGFHQADGLGQTSSIQDIVQSSDK